MYVRVNEACGLGVLETWRGSCVLWLSSYVVFVGMQAQDVGRYTWRHLGLAEA